MTAPRPSRPTSCRGFARSEAGRIGAARAGDGLPAIEPGMPTPAGTGLSRRAFVLRSAGLAMSVYGADRFGLGAFRSGVAEAAATTGGRVLVSVYLPGGVDALSVLAPTGYARYTDLRTSLRVSGGTAHRVDPKLSWAPSMAGIATLDAEGKVAAAPAIGRPDADQSHFTSRHVWETGDLGLGATYGWLGRFLDRHGSDGNPLQGLSLSSNLSPALAAATVPVAAVDDPFDTGMWTPGIWTDALPPFHDALADLGALPTADPQVRTARVAQAQAEGTRRQLEVVDGATVTAGGYPVDDQARPTVFARRLAAVAELVDRDLPLRCVTVDAPGGYDTHDGQAWQLPGQLKQLSDGLLAFQRDLERRGLADRVLVQVWSEFGRRPQQNPEGTDHGAAGIGLLIGSRVRGGLLGEFPGLTTLDESDNLRSSYDFRSLYCSVLEEWFGADADGLVPGAKTLPRVPILRAA